MGEYRIRVAVCASLILPLAATAAARPQEGADAVRAVVAEGTTMRVALDRKVRIASVGQEVTAIVIEPVYAFDRVVIAAGTRVVGHIAQLPGASAMTRTQRVMSGDFTPPRTALVQFDRLMPDGGSPLEVKTRASAGSENVTLKVAEALPEEPGLSQRAREEAARRLKDAIAVVAASGKLERLKDASVASLPYHPTYLRKGTVYAATLTSPLDFGSVASIPRAAAGTPPKPGSILAARLLTPIHSARSVRGDRVEAILTQPVFAADGSLILPEGTKLEGSVTFSKGARRFHRNGQLRFLFERVQPPDGTGGRLLASLYSVEARQADRVSVDDEGGATSTNASTRFIAPAVGALALVGSLHSSVDPTGADGGGPETNYGVPGSSAAGGMIGFGALGVVLTQASRWVTVAITSYGVVRTTYSAIFGRGRDVVFPAGTAIQVRLAPARE
jgi:hypothetical protein